MDLNLKWPRVRKTMLHTHTNTDECTQAQTWNWITATPQYTPTPSSHATQGVLWAVYFLPNPKGLGGPINITCSFMNQKWLFRPLQAFWGHNRLPWDLRMPSKAFPFFFVFVSGFFALWGLIRLLRSWRGIALSSWASKREAGGQPADGDGGYLVQVLSASGVSLTTPQCYCWSLVQLWSGLPLGQGIVQWFIQFLSYLLL